MGVLGFMLMLESSCLKWMTWWVPSSRYTIPTWNRGSTWKSTKVGGGQTPPSQDVTRIGRLLAEVEPRLFQSRRKGKIMTFFKQACWIWGGGEVLAEIN
jgi:hypothetical protein